MSDKVEAGVQRIIGIANTAVEAVYNRHKGVTHEELCLALLVIGGGLARRGGATQEEAPQTFIDMLQTFIDPEAKGGLVK